MASEPVVFVYSDERSSASEVERVVRTAGFSTETCRSVLEFIERGTRNGPSCLVIDAPAPDRHLATLRRIKETPRSFPVMITCDDCDVPTAVRLVRAGALNVLPRPYDADALIDSVREGIRMDQRRLESLERRLTVRRRLAKLTPREHDIMRYVVDGLTTKQIAARLHISQRTVEVHRRHIMDKLEIDTVASLVRLVLTAED